MTAPLDAIPHKFNGTRLHATAATCRPPSSGTTDAFVGHEAVAHGRSGAMPARSSMIMVMNA